jgi:hypothetical protein
LATDPEAMVRFPALPKKKSVLVGKQGDTTRKYGKIILKWVLEKQVEVTWVGTL